MKVASMWCCAGSVRTLIHDDRTTVNRAATPGLQSAAVSVHRGAEHSGHCPPECSWCPGRQDTTTQQQYQQPETSEKPETGHQCSLLVTNIDCGRDCG